MTDLTNDSEHQPIPYQFDWDSTPLTNYVLRDRLAPKQAETVQKQIDQLNGSHRLKKVEWHLSKLGKPLLIWNSGEHRFHVWEGADWRAFVNDVYGVAFEVRDGIRTKRALAAWDDYRAKMGIPEIPKETTLTYQLGYGGVLPIAGIYPPKGSFRKEHATFGKFACWRVLQFQDTKGHYEVVVSSTREDLAEAALAKAKGAKKSCAQSASKPSEPQRKSTATKSRPRTTKKS